MAISAGSAPVVIASDQTAVPVSTDLGKTEDAPHSPGDIGAFILGVRFPTTPASITSASLDYSPLIVDAEGKAIVTPYAPKDYYWQGTGSKADTTDLAIKAAGAGGVRNYITDIVLSNSSASTSTTVNVKDGSTVIYTVVVPANSTVALNFNIPLKGSVATAVNVAAVAAVTSLIINAQGYIGV